MSTSGVALAITLVFMQLGFLWAVAVAATQIYDHLQFDILLRSPDYFHFCDPRDFPRSYFYEVGSMPEVKSVKPLLVTLATWRIPKTAQEHAGELRGIVAMGIDPSDNVFHPDLVGIETHIGLLTNPHNLLIDSKTKGSDYGAINGKRFGDEDLGREVEVWDKRFRIVGLYALGAGLNSNGSVLMSSEGYGRFFPTDTVHNVNYGLVSLDKDKEVDPVDFCRRLQQRFSLAAANGPECVRGGAPVQALTRSEVSWYEMHRWVVRTPIGAIFIAGVVVALVVGGVVVYMVLSNDVANHLHEYATLKAMGYTNGYLSGVVMQQAVFLAVLGYVVALTCAELLYRIVGYYANLPMEMIWHIRLLVLALSIGMCCVSGLATLRKLRSADPADLF